MKRIKYSNTLFTAKNCRSNLHLFIKQSIQHILLKEKKPNKEYNLVLLLETLVMVCSTFEAVQMYIVSIHLLNQHNQLLHSIYNNYVQIIAYWGE